MFIVLGLGLVVGAILALTGAGGGFLAVPLLVFGIQMGVAQAAPIGLLAVGPMAAALGAVLGLREGIVRYGAAMLIAVAFRTFRQATRPPAAIPTNFRSLHPCKRDSATGCFRGTSSCARALALSGTVAGLLSGLLGVGGGFVMVPALQRYTDLAMRSVVASSLAVIALVSVTGVVTSAATGGILWSVSYVWRGNVFTGDTLLIDGCGRTDFRSGSSAALFDSVVGKLFALPDATRIWPGHGYKGQSVSTIGWEKRHNARLANRSKEDFGALMAALNLPTPKLIDIAVPANQNLGLPHGA